MFCYTAIYSKILSTVKQNRVHSCNMHTRLEQAVHARLTEYHSCGWIHHVKKVSLHLMEDHGFGKVCGAMYTTLQKQTGLIV